MLPKHISNLPITRDSVLPWIQRRGMALLVDFYELTMLAGYHATGKVKQRACFEYSFRELPLDTGFAVTAGLEQLLDFLEHLRFGQEDLDFLDDMGKFTAEFLDYLAKFSFACSIWAVPEGSVVFPSEPLVRVEGPLGQAQLIETFLLNALNYATLIATKSARVCLAAKPDPVMEFGLRRAPGPDGGLTGSRAAYIGGVSATSNVLAGWAYGIPVSGTQAHSWVMSFDDELEAFRTYARIFPDKPILLVDTYDTAKTGLPKALKVFQELRAKHPDIRPTVRLDSGDLAGLSRLAYKMFTEASFDNPLIIASGDLDESQIAELKGQGAKINAWGVGTKLITSGRSPALGGVYKLTAISQTGQWTGRMKVSSSTEKMTLPGRKRLWRCFNKQGHCFADVIALADEEIHQVAKLPVADPSRPDQRQELKGIARCCDLLKPVMKSGQKVADREPLELMRQRGAESINALPSEVKLLNRPGRYPVYLSDGLARMSEQLLKGKSKNKRS